jgi:RND family efflux transporter MFP subunit
MEMRTMAFVKSMAQPAGFGCIAAFTAAITVAAWPSAAFATEYSFDCVADPSKLVKINSPVSGILNEVLVRRGDTVKMGQIVATMDSEVEAAAVAVNRARAASEADIQVQQARLVNSRSKLKRAESLFKRGISTTAQIEDLRAELRVIEGQFSQAQLTRKLARLELDRSLKVLAQRVIKSPINGIVTQRLLSKGEFVFQEGSIINLAKIDPLYVEVYLPVAHQHGIKKGDAAQVELSFNKNKEYAAKVVVVDRVFDSASGTFGVRLELPNPGNQLAAGQRCKVRFELPKPASEGRDD